MKLYYLANNRIPTEKAHGLTIVKSCDALARAGAEVTLIIPRRRTPIETDLFETYGVERTFSVETVPTIDWLYTHGALASLCASLLFAGQVYWRLRHRPKEDTVLYTRDSVLMLLRALQLPIFLESHHVFGKRWIYFALARLAQGVVVISRALRQTFLVAGFPETNIIVEPSGVDLDTFTRNESRDEARAALGLPQKSPLLVYTGNFTTMGADKGLSDILRALTALPEATFIAIGGGEIDRERYQREAESLHVAGRVQLLGFAPQRVLAEYQRAADILLMPFPDTAHYRNNMSPVKMFEYMASGTPIIATRLPTITEVLNEGNAVLVTPGEPVALAHAIKMLLAETERGARLALEAQRQVTRYAWRERSARVLAFIQAKVS